MGLCCWFGWHFQDLLSKKGVTFSIVLLEWGLTHFHDLEILVHNKVRIYKQEGSN